MTWVGHDASGEPVEGAGERGTRTSSPPDDLWRSAELRLGRTLFALGWMGLGLTHFLFGDFTAGRAPGWPEGWSGQTPVAYLTGLAFILAGAAVLAGRRAWEGMVFTAGLIAVWALARHLPEVYGSELFSAAWTQAGKAFVFCGGALAVATTFDVREDPVQTFPVSRGSRGFHAFSFRAAQATVGGFLVLTGIQHFLHTPFVASLIPGWFPGDPILWTRITGIALVGGGLGILVPRSRRWTALLAGSMVLSWFFIVHVNQEIIGAGDGLAVYEALVVSGILFVVAARGAREGSGRADPRGMPAAEGPAGHRGRPDGSS